MIVDNGLRIILANGYEPELDRAERDSISFDTFYPGGLFGALAFFVRRDVTRTWGLRQHQMIRVTNGLETVWEGEVTGITYVPGGAAGGFRVEALGYWATILAARQWRKPWAEKRIDNQQWVWRTDGQIDKCNINRQDTIKFIPRSTRDTAGNEVGWSLNQWAGVTFYAPVGETVKRVTATVNFQESTQAWEVTLRDSTNSVDLVSYTTNQTNTALDHTLVTPVRLVSFLLWSRAAQTPASDGTIYAEFSNITVYTETGSINLTEIAKDIRAHETDLSAYEGLIASNTYSLVPFVSEGESLGDCLLRACGYGDADGDAWAASIVESAKGTDGKPVLRVEQQPALTAFDYAIRLDEPNVEPGVEFTSDISEVRNWIAVKYRTVDGRDAWITPDDDAALTDATSVTNYGERHEWLDVDTTSSTIAKAFGVRYLGQYKNPRWQATGGITVKGYIRTAGGGILPACRVRAGTRLKVDNYLNDLNGSGLTLLISGTQYSAADESVRLTVGVPDYLAVQIARMEAR